MSHPIPSYPPSFRVAAGHPLATTAVAAGAPPAGDDGARYVYVEAISADPINSIPR